MAQRGRISKLEGSWFSLVWNKRLGWAKLYHPMAPRHGRSFCSRVHSQAFGNRGKKKGYFDSRDPPQSLPTLNFYLLLSSASPHTKSSADGIDDEQELCVWRGSFGPSRGRVKRVCIYEEGSLCVCWGEFSWPTGSHFDLSLPPTVHSTFFFFF